jgi:hypothetical protein
MNVISNAMCLAIGLLAGATTAGAADLPRGDYVAGDLTLRFERDGHFHVATAGKHYVDGTYAVAGDMLTLVDVSGEMACAKAQATGTYRWSLDGGKLRLVKIADACTERAQDLAAQAWTAKPQ